MFSKEREEINRWFNYFKEKCGEEVNIMTSVLETDDLAIDLVIGDSEEIRGVRVFKIYGTDEDDDEEEEDEEEEVEDEEDHPDDCECEECCPPDDDEEDEEEDEGVAAEVFDLVRDDKADIQGKPVFQIILADLYEDSDDDEEHEDGCDCEECSGDDEDDEEEDDDEENDEENDSEDEAQDESIELTIYSEDGTLGTKIICGVMRYLKENNRQEVYILDNTLFEWQTISI
jgi:hypothetical protein